MCGDISLWPETWVWNPVFYSGVQCERDRRWKGLSRGSSRHAPQVWERQAEDCADAEVSLGRSRVLSCSQPALPGGQGFRKWREDWALLRASTLVSWSKENWGASRHDPAVWPATAAPVRMSVNVRKCVCERGCVSVCVRGRMQVVGQWAVCQGQFMSVKVYLGCPCDWTLFLRWHTYHLFMYNTFES